MTNEEDGTVLLDLLSTSQTFQRCTYGAPLVALMLGERNILLHGCCNHWDCERCGLVRAKQEYNRIVHGCEVLAIEHKLYFWTITCRGKECSYEEAEANYYAWTNVLLTNARAKCNRAGDHWAYVQVTEHQKKTRAHPHSHIITTFLPSDAVRSGGTEERPTYVSVWFSRANVSALLGEQHRISGVASAAAVSRYVAKYMFKECMTATWRKGWKRVRYSRNFPKPAAMHADWTQVLASPQDWRRIGHMPVMWECPAREDFEIARHHIPNVISGTYA